MPPDPPGPTLLSQDPPLPADDFIPALWVPIARLISERRRILTMIDQLPADAWIEPSALDGWTRRDILAHLASNEANHQRAIRAAIEDRPLTTWQPDPDDPTLEIAGWNEQRVAERAAWPFQRIVDELHAGLAETLDLLRRVEDRHLSSSYGFTDNMLSGLDRRVAHEREHATDIVNGPQMMR
jgi:uncharacterized protein (TIGR03083 family)